MMPNAYAPTPALPIVDVIDRFDFAGVAVLGRAALCALLAAMCGCGEYPRDPDGTSRRVTASVMRVGVVHDPPFVIALSSQPHGREASLVQRFARTQRAHVAWRRGGHDALMRQLEKRQLDMVLGGLTQDSPWNAHVAGSRPYSVRDAQGRLVRRVVALPPGENAWLLRFDRFARSDEARAALEAPNKAPTP